jgi:hypothetical protein
MSLRELNAGAAISIRDYFEMIHSLSIFGRVFPVGENPLSYTPMIAACNIEFKRYKNRISFESHYQ